MPEAAEDLVAHYEARSSGVVIADPMENPADGLQLQISGMQYPPWRTNRPMDWTHFDGTLLQVWFEAGDIARVLGSAVLVAPGIAIAAAHVLEPELESLLAARTLGYLTSCTSHGLDIWRPRQILLIPGTDLAIVTLRRASALPPDGHMRQAFISTRIPEPGELVMIAGFRAEEQEFDLRDAREIQVTGGVRVSVGHVTKYFPNGRDRAVLPWPSIEVAVSTAGGMSGGPAFDQDGRLVGVLSTSFDQPDGRGPSYISLLHAALSEPFDVPYSEGNASLLDLAGKRTFIHNP